MIGLQKNKTNLNQSAAFDSRNYDAFSLGMSMDELTDHLASRNPFRRNIQYSNKDLLNISIFSKLGLDMAHVRSYNEAVKDIAKFIELHKKKFTEIIKDSAAKIEIRVKIVDGKTSLVKKSPHYPNELLKNKNLKQYICFVAVSSNSGETEIISIPMMIGCEWCATYGKTPQELHNAGENAAMYRGFFIIESQKSTEAKYFISHKKVCHNVIVTIFDEFERKTFVTTLKTQDMNNNSVETSIYKKDNIYFLDNVDFEIKYPVTKIFKQIYLLMKSLKAKEGDFYYETYTGFMQRIIATSTDQRIADFFIFDFTENDEEPIKLPEGTHDTRSAVNLLFKKENRKNLHINDSFDHAENKFFPDILIDSIFPSVYVPNIQEGKNADIKRKYSVLEAKAMLLIQMVLRNDLTEQGIMSTTNRNDLSFKTFMNAGEIIRRDATRDGGKLIAECENKIYKFGNTVSKGDSGVTEALQFSNNLKTISDITSTAISRSNHSKNTEVRNIHFSQTGYECLLETPSGANIGLVLHTALTCCFSSSKNIVDFLNYIVSYLIREKGYDGNNLFAQEDLNESEFAIKKYIREKNINYDELKMEYASDVVIKTKISLKFKKYFSFLKENSSKIYFMFTLFNVVNGLEFKNEDLFENLSQMTNSQQILDTINQDVWLEFLKFRSEIVDDGLPFEFIIPDFDCPINRRTRFWEFAKSKNFTYENLIELIAKKRKPISLNSTPFALVDQETYEDLRKFLKRDYRFMDVVVMEDVFKINLDKKQIRYVSSFNILCDGGRSCRPLLVVNELKNRNLLDSKNFEAYIASKKRFEDIVSDGVIELVFPNETQNFHISPFISEISDQKYCEIDPYNMFGAVISGSPMVNNGPGNRAIHEAAMPKSALSTGSTNVKNSSETSAKYLHGAQVPPVTTKVAEFMTGHLRGGVNMIMGIRIENGNVEDSFVVNQRFEKLVNTEKISTYEIIISEGETVGVHLDSFTKRNKYHGVNHESGFPIIGVFLAVDDIIFAKYKIEKTFQKDQEGNVVEVPQVVNKSEPIREGKDGYVQSIFKVPNDKVAIYRITVSNIKTLEVGDKIATRYSQKGVEGMSVPYDQMPFVTSGKLKGLRPDAIFSPLSLTSRATPGLLHETLFGVHAVEFRQQFDATSFTVNDQVVARVNEQLVSRGYKPFMLEDFEDPRTKTTYKMAIGIVHARILKHTAYDKVKAIGHDCSIDKATKQPTGKNASKPMRISYMSVDVHSSFGATSIINSLTSKQSDMICVPLCSKCGMICDRFNDDPNSIVDFYAAKHCTRCHEKGTIRKTMMSNAAIKVARTFLQIGVMIDYFPVETII